MGKTNTRMGLKKPYSRKFKSLSSEERLQYLLDILSEVPSINSGGCGLVVYTAYLFIDDNSLCAYGFSHSTDNAEKNISYIQNKEGTAEGDSHFAFSLNDKLYDGKGILEKCEQSRYSIQYRIENNDIERFFTCAINNITSWNPSFQRRPFFTLIKRTLGINLKKILDEAISQPS